MATELKVTQIKGMAGKTDTVRRILLGMGLRKQQQSVILPDTPEVRGMIYKVPHLVKVERVPAGSRQSARARARSAGAE